MWRLTWKTSVQTEETCCTHRMTELLHHIISNTGTFQRIIRLILNLTISTYSTMTYRCLLGRLPAGWMEGSARTAQGEVCDECSLGSGALKEVTRACLSLFGYALTETFKNIFFIPALWKLIGWAMSPTHAIGFQVSEGIINACFRGRFSKRPCKAGLFICIYYENMLHKINWSMEMWAFAG